MSISTITLVVTANRPIYGLLSWFEVHFGTSGAITSMLPTTSVLLGNEGVLRKIAVDTILEKDQIGPNTLLGLFAV